MKTLNSIPTSKIRRASKLIQTGAKVGLNYLKYYGDKMMTDEAQATEKLNQSNAEDIYDSLKELKGSALKVAQMLSMEKNILPRAYVEKFYLSQFSVPPLSGPLVVKTFKKYFGKNPNQIFDYFNPQSTNAASIGQVHQAELNGKKLAVKIQYPGVAESISSDLAMVKPIAIKMFNIKGKDSDKYFKEVETKLLEETDYVNELQQSEAIAHSCKHLPGIVFPKYYKALSSERIITMDWMQGLHLSEFTAQNDNETIANNLGQALWDFYMFQIHGLKKVHADPHPGNFLVSADNKLVILDFGCMKTIPDDFYTPYFELAQKEKLAKDDFFIKKLFDLQILREDDTKKEQDYFTSIFHELLTLFTQPFKAEFFDFSNETFFKQIADLGQKFTKDSQLKKMNGNRGSKHFIYMNRTFFGLYNLMHDLKSRHVKINNFEQYLK